MAHAVDIVALLATRAALFLLCRSALLPLLFGEAQHASLAPEPIENHALGSVSSLPSPATTAAKRNANGASAHAALSADGLGTTVVLGGVRVPLYLSSGLLFSLSFEESASLFAFVLLEALGVDRGTLRANWHFSLVAVLALAIAIIPFGICLQLTMAGSPSGAISRRVLWALPPFLLWLLLFLRVPLPSAMSSASTGYLDAALARTAVLGVTLIGLLSGGAAIISAWDTWEAFFAKKRPRAPTAGEVRSAEDSFRRTCQDLASRRAELKQLRDRPLDPSERGNYFARLFSSSPREKEMKALSAEISGLELVAGAMRDDLDSMRTQARNAAWSKTIQGRALLGAGHVFSVYCVWRIVLAIVNLLILGYRDTVPPDFVTLGLASFFRLFSLHVDLAVWARQISLLFVGALILLRMRYVLSGLSSVFRAASSGSSASFLILFLAKILTIYLLSTLIQLRTALPPSFSAGEAVAAAAAAASSSALGEAHQPMGALPLASTPPPPPSPPPSASMTTTTTPLQLQLPPPLLSTLPSFTTVFGAVFDGAFLVAALATGVHRWLTRDAEGGPLFGSRAL